MFGKKLVRCARACGLGAVVILLTAMPAQSYRSDGCMSEAEEEDPIFNDIWHGGESPKPEYHPDCDVEPGPDTCEWLEETSHGVYSDYHSGWDIGYLSGGHEYQEAGSCGTGS